MSHSPVSLFKIVSVKDEIIIGLSQKDLDTMAAVGAGHTDAVARSLVRGGHLTAWTFAVRKGADGQLEQAPHARVSIIGNDTLRIEPYQTPLRIVSISA